MKAGRHRMTWAQRTAQWRQRKANFVLLSGVLYTGAGQTPAPLVPPPPPSFSDAERVAVQAYWNVAGRIAVRPPDDAATKGVWQVRLTPDGSAWFLKYQIAIGAAKAPPTASPTALADANPTVAIWKTWVASKLAWDRDRAEEAAEIANHALSPALPLKKRERMAPPGPIPADLLTACSSPPPFANIVAPLVTTITFADGSVYTYTDNVRVGSPSYAYYRFPQGTVNYGKPLREMTDAELDSLFAAAGLNPTEQHSIKAVSRLEGGFDAVNTYDTGFVSIGFIQFITAKDGRGSLREVLQQEKNDAPDAFAKDFHNLGIDVTPDGALVVVDPDTGAELTGADAVQKTIADKRLTAIWQKAGHDSTAFRVAQIKVAKAHYWPAEDAVSLVINGVTVTGKVSDIVHSEAGLTTLFDRKVNRGNIAPFSDMLAKVMAAHQCQTLADAAKYEREIIAACKYRVDFLQDTTLAQPPLPDP